MSWKKGLTKYSSEKVRKAAEKTSKTLSGKKRKPLSEEHKRKISRSVKNFLKRNPDRVPYLLNHSSNDSWPEKVFKSALELNKVEGWVHRYRNGIYQYDFAFPMEKIDVEIDGQTHSLAKTRNVDKKRDEWSRRQGWKIIRFDARLVRRKVQKCIQILEVCLKDHDVDVDRIIEKESLMLRTKLQREQLKAKERRIEEKRKKQILRESRMIDVKKTNLKKIGWVASLGKRWSISHTQVRRIMKRDFPEFLEHAFRRS